jgi:hypothetical protein
MIEFVLWYLFIGSVISAIFEYILSKNEDLKDLGEDFEVTNLDRVFTIVLWPVAVLYVIFG